MKFSDLAWAALLYYYNSSGDRKYVKLFRDTSFIAKLRQTPRDIPYEEFEEKVILGFISSVGLRLPAVRGDRNILTEIIELQPIVSSLQGISLLECDLSDKDLLKNISQIYDKLHAIHGFWVTGISKITHILNDSLFVVMDLSTASYFGLLGEAADYIKWLTIVQKSAQEVTDDFFSLGYPGSPEEFLSEKLGYVNYGCQKSLIRFLDEYYWLTTSQNLPIPPTWLPSF